MTDAGPARRQRTGVYSRADDAGTSGEIDSSQGLVTGQTQSPMQTPELTPSLRQHDIALHCAHQREWPARRFRPQSPYLD